MKFDVKKSNDVKCIAIILMLIHHLFACSVVACQTYGVYTIWMDWDKLMRFSAAGKVCVATYVFLTAYGIAKSYLKNEDVLSEKKEFEKFCFNRYIKLVLNFIFVYIISIMTSFLREVKPMEVYMSKENGRELIYALFDATGIASYFGTPTINETWWYMSLAITLVFVIPVFSMIYKKIGKILVIFAFLIGMFGVSRGNVLCGYLFVACTGVLFAEESYFEKIYNLRILNNQYLNKIFKLLVSTILFVLYMFKRDGYIYWLDSCVPILLAVIVMEATNLVPLIEKPMNFIGKHSMNIFLIHTLIFKYYFREFIYEFKYWLFVLLALLITSLLGSIVIEWLKKVLKFDMIIKKISL